MPAVAVFHPSCSRGLRRAIALLRKPAGIDRREAVETSRRSPPSQRPRYGNANLRSAQRAKGPHAAHRCADSRRRGLERRLQPAQRPAGPRRPIAVRIHGVGAWSAGFQPAQPATGGRSRTKPGVHKRGNRWNRPRLGRTRGITGSSKSWRSVWRSALKPSPPGSATDRSAGPNRRETTPRPGTRGAQKWVSPKFVKVGVS